jgi:hypothetical protein
MKWKRFLFVPPSLSRCYPAAFFGTVTEIALVRDHGKEQIKDQRAKQGSIFPDTASRWNERIMISSSSSMDTRNGLVQRTVITFCEMTGYAPMSRNVRRWYRERFAVPYSGILTDLLMKGP